MSRRQQGAHSVIQALENAYDEGYEDGSRYWAQEDQSKAWISILSAFRAPPEVSVGDSYPLLTLMRRQYSLGYEKGKAKAKAELQQVCGELRDACDDGDAA